MFTQCKVLGLMLSVWKVLSGAFSGLNGVGDCETDFELLIVFTEVFYQSDRAHRRKENDIVQKRIWPLLDKDNYIT